MTHYTLVSKADRNEKVRNVALPGAVLAGTAAYGAHEHRKQSLFLARRSQAVHDIAPGRPPSARAAAEAAKLGRQYRLAGKIRTGAAATAVGLGAVTGVAAHRAKRREVAKADRRQFPTSPIGEVGPDIGEGARAPRNRGGRAGRRVPRITSMGDTAGAIREARRGAKGAFQAHLISNAGVMANRMGPKGRRNMRAAANQATWYAQAGSPHPKAFRAGAHAGKAGVVGLRTARNPYYLMVAGGGAMAVGVAAKDRREAQKRLAARRKAAAAVTTVTKALGPKGAAAALSGILVGSVATGHEIARRQANKGGADIRPLEPYRHPIRTGYKKKSVEWDRNHEWALKRAAKLDEQAEKHGDTVKGEYRRVRADRMRENANISAFNAQTYQRAAQIGARRTDAETRRKPYKSGTTYQLPDRPTKRVKKSAFEVELAKALPGDNRDAEMARSRRKAGLGVAGGGYLLASRSKDMAPGAADLITRRADKNGGPKARKKLVRVRAGKIASISGKSGAVLAGAGLALAGEGAVNDLRYRQALSRTRQEAREARARKATEPVRKSAFEVELAKAYQYGKITEHHEQAAMHARKKKAADRRMQVGAATVPAALAAGGAVQHAVKTHGPKWVVAGGNGDDVLYRTGGGDWKSSSGTDRVVRRLKVARRVHVGAGWGGVGLAAAGAGLAAEGAISRTVHGHKQNTQTKEAQAARRARNASIGKALDSEAQRHKRQAAYTGGAAGGAVAATAGGVAAGVRGRKLRNLSRSQAGMAAAKRGAAQEQLAHMMLPKGNPNAKVKSTRAVGAARDLHSQAAGHADTAAKLAGKARKVTRLSRASLVAAGLLGATGYGVHDHDRRDRSRGYGY